MSRTHCPPPTVAVPSEDRPEGRGDGVCRVNPKPAGKEGDALKLHINPLYLIEYAAVHTACLKLCFCFGSNLCVKASSFSFYITHKTTSMTGRASTEVCKTVKVYVNNEINMYLFRATHGSIIIQMCFGLKNSL